MGSAIFPAGIDDDVASVEGCHRACMAVTWLFTLGFTISFAGILCKMWRINLVIESAAKFRRSKITVWRTMIPLVVLVLLNVILMLIWTLIDPMRWKRVSNCESSGESSYGYCTLGNSPVSNALFGSVLAVNLCALILASWQAYKARGVSQQFSESRWIFMMMIGILQISVIALPIMALVTPYPRASFFVRSALIFVLCMTILLLLFVPKIRHLRKEEESKKEREESLAEGSVGSSKGSRRSGSHGKVPVPKAFKAKPEETFFGSTAKSRDSKRPSRRTPEVSNAVLLTKVMQLDELLRKDGIDTAPLLHEVGIDLPAFYPIADSTFAAALAESEGLPYVSRSSSKRDIETLRPAVPENISSVPMEKFSSMKPSSTHTTHTTSPHVSVASEGSEKGKSA